MGLGDGRPGCVTRATNGVRAGDLIYRRRMRYRDDAWVVGDG
jgi:hypothetical protein